MGDPLAYRTWNAWGWQPITPPAEKWLGLTYGSGWRSISVGGCAGTAICAIGATVGTPRWRCVDTPVVTVFTAQNSIDKFENEITLEDDAHAVLA